MLLSESWLAVTHRGQKNGTTVVSTSRNRYIGKSLKAKYKLTLDCAETELRADEMNCHMCKRLN